MRVILIALCGILIFIALEQTQKPLYFWLCIATLATTSIIVSGKFFSFFLTTLVLSFNYSDLSSDSGFYSLLLPLYTWVALVILILSLYFKFSAHLGQQVKRPGGSFWDSFGDGDC